MTCGVYKLVFNNTNKVYIGLSINIENRFKQHMYLFDKKEAAKKLQDAYDKYGPPTYTVLIICVIKDLNKYEMEYILKYNSIDNGFNTSVGGIGNAPGEINPNSKYSNAFIEEVFLYVYVNPSQSIRSIAKLFDIPYPTLYDIVSGKGHSWLQEKHSDIYLQLVSKTGARVKGNGRNSSNAQARGISYPKLKSPTGNVLEILSFNKFMLAHNLSGNSVRRLIAGVTKSYKGWTIVDEV